MKDSNLKKYKISLLRFATIGSDELIQIEVALDKYENGR